MIIIEDWNIASDVDWEGGMGPGIRRDPLLENSNIFDDIAKLPNENMPWTPSLTLANSNTYLNTPVKKYIDPHMYLVDILCFKDGLCLVPTSWQFSRCYLQWNDEHKNRKKLRNLYFFFWSSKWMVFFFAWTFFESFLCTKLYFLNC